MSDPRQDDPGARLRVALSSTRPGLSIRGAWLLTAGIVLVGGATLYASRGAIGGTLDRWLPKLEPAPPETPPETPVVPTPGSGIELPAEPEWTYVDVEAAVLPLPEQTEILIAEGRAELPEFSELESSDEGRSLAIRNRWRLWGRIWHNRVAQIRRPMPPAEVCDVHAALEPTCRALSESLTLLDRVPVAGNVEQATELLDEAAAILEELRLSREPGAEEADTTERPL